MASEKPPTEQDAPAAPRRGRFRAAFSRKLAVVLALATLVAFGVVAYGVWGSGTDAPGSIAALDGPAAEGPGRPGATLWASHSTVRASTAVARRAEAITLQGLVGALSEAIADGGSPIAVVISPTALRSEPGGRVVEHLGVKTEFESPRVHAIVSLEGRWLEVIAAELPNDETGWIHAEDVEVHGVDHSMRADLSERTLEVWEGGEVARRFPIAVGGPETPTPTGTFAVTDKLRMTEEGSYGCCLLAFSGHQPDIPQGWTGGDRLAVHATPDPAAIGQAVSLGCFRASDADMRWLLDEVPLGTPVTVVP